MHRLPLASSAALCLRQSVTQFNGRRTRPVGIQLGQCSSALLRRARAPNRENCPSPDIDACVFILRTSSTIGWTWIAVGRTGRHLFCGLEVTGRAPRIGPERSFCCVSCAWRFSRLPCRGQQNSKLGYIGVSPSSVDRRARHSSSPAVARHLNNTPYISQSET